MKSGPVDFITYCKSNVETDCGYFMATFCTEYFYGITEKTIEVEICTKLKERFTNLS
jgi:hypothetical protein